MDSATLAELNSLRSEIAQLRTEFLMSSAGGDAAPGGEGIGLPLVPIGGGGDGGAFRFEGDKITHCNFYAAHQVIELADVTIPANQANGTWYLNVPHSNLSGATVSTTYGANDDDNTCIPLFEISNGEITKDYRGMPFVPIYA